MHICAYFLLFVCGRTASGEWNGFSAKYFVKPLTNGIYYIII